MQQSQSSAKLIAISDIHLGGNDDPLVVPFCALLSDLHPGDVLILGGDIFDFLMTSKANFRRRYSRAIESIRETARRGVTIHLIEGNHDLLMADLFAGETNIVHHDAEAIVHFGGKKIYAAHGDLIDESDRGYLFLRWFLRSPFLRFLAWIVPGVITEWIGGRGSRYSRIQHQASAHGGRSTAPLFREFAGKKIQKGYDFVILGHNHELDLTPSYGNVGFPRIHGSYLELSGDNQNVLTLKLKPLATLSG